MLTHLSIQGLAIVDSVNIEFGLGFNVITGETGAGKSILIKALGLLLGSKAQPDSVRKGFDQANVSGRFVVKEQHPALDLLASWGVETDEDEHGRGVIIRRQITAKGRSQAWINDVPVTTTSLKELSESLIDVFGQHDNHRLLDVTFHSRYLDEFLKDKSLAAKVESTWKETSAAMTELKEFIDEVRGKGRDLDYLSFRLKELETFQPSEADYEKIRGLSERAKSSLQLSAALQRASEALEDESGVSLAKRLREVARSLSQAKLPDLDTLSEHALKIAEEIDELSFGLGRVSQQIEISEDDVDLAEERIAGYQSLFRKHGVHNAAELLVEWEKTHAQVAAIEDAAGHFEKLVGGVAARTAQLVDQSKALTKARSSAVDAICRTVERELSDLAMPAARFRVELEAINKPQPSLDTSLFSDATKSQWKAASGALTTHSEHGAERAQFYLASNAGEPSLPLAKVASGGEVSRIMLALKKALLVGAETCVLVFDEIDTGISGRIADTVGRKIAELSSLCQVVCISHLPQVAAYATAHYIVEKEVKGQRTESNIRQLEDGERLEEIARILSGKSVTPESLSHAKSLVAEAHTKIKQQGQPKTRAGAVKTSIKPAKNPGTSTRKDTAATSKRMAPAQAAAAQKKHPKTGAKQS